MWERTDRITGVELTGKKPDEIIIKVPADC